MDEEEYFRGVEAHFNQKRGNPWPLSPRELKLIDEWHEAGIPFEVVIRGIDRAFEKKEGAEDKEISRLTYCRRPVKSEYKKYMKALEGTPAAGGGASVEAQNVSQYLRRLADSLGKSAAEARAAGNGALADFLQARCGILTARILAPFEMNQQTDLQRVEQQLTDLEKEIEQVLLTMISEEQITRFKEEAMRELKSFEGKLDLAVYQEMLRRALIKSVRNQYNIPRLSLFYM